MDISVVNVEIVECRLCDIGVIVMWGSGMKMFYGENFFDYVFCVEGGFYMNSREDFFWEVFWVFKLGGKLLVVDFVVLKVF